MDIKIIYFVLRTIYFCYSLARIRHFMFMYIFRKVYVFQHLVSLIRGFYLFSNYNMLSCHLVLVRTIFKTSWHE
ncbi:hypothetical protein Hanom_Chr05g00418861 [Helianthus anomalus]